MSKINPPIVLLHGFLGSKKDWLPVIQYLQAYECIPINLPGHEGSMFKEELEIDLSYFHLVGYSMGGRIAMQYAEKHPEKIASLHLISTHPGLSCPQQKALRYQSDKKWAEKLLALPIDEFLNQWYNQPIFKPFVPDLTLRKKHSIPDLCKAFLHFSLSRQKKYVVEDGIVGERDEKFIKLYQKPVIIPRSGHMVHLENPKTLSQVIQKRIRCNFNSLEL